MAKYRLVNESGITTHAYENKKDALESMKFLNEYHRRSGSKWHLEVN